MPLKHARAAVPADRSDSQHRGTLYILRLNQDKLNVSRVNLSKRRHERSAQASISFVAPLLPKQLWVSTNDFPVAESQYQRAISAHLLQDDDCDVDDVINAVTEVVQQWQMA